MNEELDKSCKELLLKIARQTIESLACGEKLPRFQTDSAFLQEKRGAFVSLHKKGELRGCIGYVIPCKPLITTVIEMAEAAAFRDPRFCAIEPHEVKDIDIQISVISPMQLIADICEITVGKHGLLIEKGMHNGLLLPQVAVENKWDRTEFLEYTCMKAGLHKNAWQDENAKIFVFTADVFGEEEFGVVEHG